MVTTGATSGNKILIETGLTAGERVVTDGQLKLVDGSKVEIFADKSATSPGTTPEAGHAASTEAPK